MASTLSNLAPRHLLNRALKLADERLKSANVSVDHIQRLELAYVLQQEIYNHHRYGLMMKGLPSNGPDEDEVIILRGKTKDLPVQSISFLDLPAEIRNRIYKFAMPSNERKDELSLVATPFKDDLMDLGTQPAITRVSRQLRAESLQMVYANALFVGYIKDFDFSGLVRWVECITSGALAPKVTVKIKLLDHITCTMDLVPFWRDWRDMEHSDKVHLKLQNCFPKLGQAVPRNFNQRLLVQKVAHMAKGSRRMTQVPEGHAEKAYILGAVFKSFQTYYVNGGQHRCEFGILYTDDDFLECLTHNPIWARTAQECGQITPSHIWTRESPRKDPSSRSGLKAWISYWTVALDLDSLSS